MAKSKQQLEAEEREMKAYVKAVVAKAPRWTEKQAMIGLRALRPDIEVC